MIKRAARTHRVLTCQELIAIGYTARTIQRRIERGMLTPRHRGVYIVGPPVLDDTGRLYAAVKACGARAAASHFSSAWLAGIADPPRLPWVTSAVPVRSRPGIEISTSGTLTTRMVARRFGIPYTTVPRTLLDLAVILDAPEMTRLIERAEQEELFNEEAVRALIAGSNGHRGTGRLRRLLDEIAGPEFTRSEFERYFLAFCRERNLPMPIANSDVIGFEVDMYWPDHGLIVELDSRKWHRSMESFEADREKSTRLTVAGFRVIRVTSKQFSRRPDELEASLRSLLGLR